MSFPYQSSVRNHSHSHEGDEDNEHGSNCSCTTSDSYTGSSHSSHHSEGCSSVDSSCSSISPQHDDDISPCPSSLSVKSSEISIEWITDSTDSKTGNLFYLKLLQSRPDCENRPGSCQATPRIDKTSQGETKYQKSKYSRLTSWLKKKKSNHHKHNKDNHEKTVASSNPQDKLMSLSEEHKSPQSIPQVEVTEVSNDNQQELKSTVDIAGCCQSHVTAENAFVNLLVPICPRSDSKSTEVFPFMCLYLTPVNARTEQVSAGDRDCLSFCYPSKSANQFIPCQTAIVCKLKGMFLTLSQVVSDITGQRPSVTEISLHPDGIKDRWQYEKEQDPNDAQVEDTNEVPTDNTFVVGLDYEYNSVLAVVVPREVDRKVIPVQHLTQRISQVIKLMFLSLDAGFKNSENHQTIHHLLDIFSTCITPELFHFDILLGIANFCAQRLVIDDDELSLTLSDLLSEYEATDWLTCELQSCRPKSDGSLGTSGSAGDFIVIGSTLFFKGFLVTSHLPVTFLSDIVVFLHFRGLIQLSRMSSYKLVSWCEVHPTKRGSQKTPNSMTSDFADNEGSRFFLLIVNVRHTMLTVLFEVPFLSVDCKVLPNETIILQTLRFITLNFEKMELATELNHHLSLHETYQEMLGDKLQEGFFTFRSKNKIRSSLKSLSLRDLFHSPPESTSGNNFLRTSTFVLPDSTNFSTSTPTLINSSSSSSLIPQQSCPDQASSSRSASPSTNITSTGQEDRVSFLRSSSIESRSVSSSVSCGGDSISFKRFLNRQRRHFPANLIFYVDHDYASNVLSAPVFPSSHFSNHDDGCLVFLRKMTTTRLANEILPRFHECCLTIQKVLRSRRLKQYGLSFSSRVSPALSHRHSSGLFIQASSSSPSHRLKAKKTSSSLDITEHFWVSGMSISTSREIYACFVVSSGNGLQPDKSLPLTTISLESLADTLNRQINE